MAAIRNASVDRQAFDNELVGHMLSLRAFCISLTHSIPAAEDLAQETLCKAMGSFSSFEKGTALGSWLFTIARNQWHSVHRKYRREVPLDMEFAERTLSTESDSEGVIDFQQMLLYLACLPKDQADALVAVGYLGIMYEEAAERLGIAVGTVKSRVNRARRLLLELMETTNLQRVDASQFKSATRGVRVSDPYYPIAKAYETLFAEVESVSRDDEGVRRRTEQPERQLSEGDALWQNLVASGALDGDVETLADLMLSE
jgi:RNA polymerase sigma-70 factor (ECF subfamily)